MITPQEEGPLTIKVLSGKEGLLSNCHRYVNQFWVTCFWLDFGGVVSMYTEKESMIHLMAHAEIYNMRKKKKKKKVLCANT